MSEICTRTWAARVASDDFYHLYYDQVGSLRVVADEAGNVVKEVLYDSFGRILNDTNPAMHVPLGFGFGLHDRDTGWVRMGWRDYDPETGRFTALDPIGYAGGDSDLYGYCVDDPVNQVDPGGLFPVVPAVGGLVGGLSNAYDDYDDWKSGKMTTGEYAGSIALGAGTGALSSIGGGGLLGTIAKGTIAASANEVGKQYIKSGEVNDVGKVARQGVYGGAGNALGYGAAKAGDMLLDYPKMVGSKLNTPVKTYKTAGGSIGNAIGTYTAKKTEDSLEQPIRRKTAR